LLTFIPAPALPDAQRPPHPLRDDEPEFRILQVSTDKETGTRVFWSKRQVGGDSVTLGYVVVTGPTLPPGSGPDDEGPGLHPLRPRSRRLDRPGRLDLVVHGEVAGHTRTLNAAPVEPVVTAAGPSTRAESRWT
jgi:hypothetical protein